jgi:hypothetical protein
MLYRCKEMFNQLLKFHCTYNYEKKGGALSE